MDDSSPPASKPAVLVRLQAIRQRPVLAYGLGVLCFLAGLGLRMSLSGVLAPRGFPFLTFFPAVVLSALVGGFGPGLLTALLSIVAAWFFFISPNYSFRIESASDLVALAFFAFVLMLDCVVIHVMNESIARAQQERETSAELARQLELRLEELRLASEQTEAASRAKSRLMASVGHDLRQPLNVISMAIQLLGHGATSQADRDLIARTRRNVDSLARTFDQLLESARLESESFRPNVIEVEMQPLLLRLIDEFSALAADKKLRFEVPDCDIRVVSDSTMLLSILRNFVGNAVKYTPSGGSIKMSVSVTDDGLALLEVIDSGAGIPPGKIELIFQEFERLGQSDGDGIGLGLSLVKKNAELLGHRLHVESTPGQGSRFGVEVPLATRRVALTDRRARGRRARRTGWRRRGA